MRFPDSNYVSIPHLSHVYVPQFAMQAPDFKSTHALPSHVHSVAPCSGAFSFKTCSAVLLKVTEKRQFVRQPKIPFADGNENSLKWRCTKLEGKGRTAEWWKKILGPAQALASHLNTLAPNSTHFWQVNNSSDSQEIPRILRNPKVHYRVHKSPPLVPILSQKNPVRARQTLSWISILIICSHLRFVLSSDLLPFRPSHQNPARNSPQYLSQAPPISYFLISSPQ